MKITNFKKLIEHQFNDLYNAEKQVMEALPKLIKATTNPELKKGFEDHLKQTKEQMKRIEQAAKSCDLDIKPITCKGMKGLIAEGEEVLESIEKGSLLDAALIGAAQKVEHYEICAYGTLISHLKEAGCADAAALLTKTLTEEGKTNEKLNANAKVVNRKAVKENE